MTYGLTSEQIRKVRKPAASVRPWGAVICCADLPQYSLQCLKIDAAKAQPLQFYPSGPRTVYVEKGEVIIRRLNSEGTEGIAVAREGQVIDLADTEVHGFASQSGAELYVFGPAGAPTRPVPTETTEAAQAAFGERAAHTNVAAGRPTSDVRDKYWGKIETIIDSDMAGKRIFIRKGGQSSLEFHVEKFESYFIQSGQLRLGLRIGRGENYSVILNSGDAFDVFPGLMHMRMALEDTVIIEASTRDFDSDSYLVEDGQTYRHIDKA